MKLNSVLKPKTQSGFTLIELLIVIAITVIITTVMMANFRSGERQKRLNYAADGFTNLIRVTQSYTLSGKQIPANAVVSTGTRCLDNNTAVRYALVITQVDLPDLGDLSVVAEDFCGATMILETFDFPTGTKIRTNGITITGCGECVTSNPLLFWFLFEPPFANMTLGNVAPSVDPKFGMVDIVLETIDGTRTKTVKVDGISGRISN